MGVTLDAPSPTAARRARKADDPEPLPYLQDADYGSYDVALEVGIANEAEMGPGAAPATVCKSNFANLYWNVKQQLVHHAVTGCNMAPGDLLGSGTISGQSQDSFGSMLELCWKGTREVPLNVANPATGAPVVRKFLKDGDRVVMSGSCAGKPGVGFGTVEGTVLPANTNDPTVAPAIAAAVAAAAALLVLVVVVVVLVVVVLVREVLELAVRYWRSSCSCGCASPSTPGIAASTWP